MHIPVPWGNTMMPSGRPCCILAMNSLGFVQMGTIRNFEYHQEFLYLGTGLESRRQGWAVTMWVGASEQSVEMLSACEGYEKGVLACSSEVLALAGTFCCLKCKSVCALIPDDATQ
eukprot:1140404-Pelagomonas_calceolata.AAC.1